MAAINLGEIAIAHGNFAHGDELCARGRRDRTGLRRGARRARDIAQAHGEPVSPDLAKVLGSK